MTLGSMHAAVLRQRQCLCLGIRASGASHCRREIVPSAASKMLQEKTAVVAGSCWWTTCRFNVKEKQQICWPQCIAHQMLGLWHPHLTSHLQHKALLVPRARQKRCSCQGCCS